MEHASRRLIHLSATAHPTAAWTQQQVREAIPSDNEYRFIIHDHDSIFSSDLDASLARLGLKAVRTPVRSPQANAICERLAPRQPFLPAYCLNQECYSDRVLLVIVILLKKRL
jgi:transposase InsO family protein